MSEAYRINESGQVVGQSSLGDGNQHAFLYDGTMHDLGTLPDGGHSSAQGINNAGQVVGQARTSDGNDHAFLYDGTMYDLNDMIDARFGWTLSAATSINSSGWIVGYGNNSTGARHGLLLTPVPDPSTFLALLCGIGGVGGLLVRRRN